MEKLKILITITQELKRTKETKKKGKLTIFQKNNLLMKEEETRN